LANVTETPLAARCWCCGNELRARYLPHVRVLECVQCGAGSTVAETLPVVDDRAKCDACGKLLAIYVARPWALYCRRCKATRVSA